MFDKNRLRLYAVTDRSWVGRQTLLEQIEAALQGGVTLVQLREKALTEAEFLEEARQVKTLCQRYQVPLIINDNVDVALKSGADGVHVGMEDAPVAEVRKRVGPDFIIGATAKTVQQAQGAQAAGADYLGVGAVYPSPTKQTALGITQEQLKEICAAVSLPAVAIGGITAPRVAELQGSGVQGVAVVSALFAPEDIQAAAQELRRAVEEMLEGGGEG